MPTWADRQRAAELRRLAGYLGCEIVSATPA
jgi:hypothetical protein